MSYLAELDVDSYGYLYGGDDVISIDPTQHRWTEPYPAVAGVMRFSWEAGSSSRKPNVFRHNLLRDFVCDAHALSALRDTVGSDLHVIGRGILDDEKLTVVQATPILDVVDEERSIASEYTWARISFPHIPEENEVLVEHRMFRVANPELSLLVFFGNALKSSMESAGVRGWNFEGAWVE